MGNACSSPDNDVEAVDDWNEDYHSDDEEAKGAPPSPVQLTRDEFWMGVAWGAARCVA